MITQLEKTLAMLNARYQATGIPRFLEWWAAELLPLIPTGIKRLFAVPHEQLLITADDDSWYLWQSNEAGYKLLDTILRDGDEEQARARVLACMDHFGEGVTAAVYCISSDSILYKSIRMPAAAEANLKQAVAFEVDRQTPFSEKNVYFDVSVAEREPPFLTVDLVLAQRQQVDQYIEEMGGLGVRLHAVDINKAPVMLDDQESEPDAMGINLLPREQRVRKANKRVRLNWALAGLVFLLLGLVMFESLYLRNQIVNQLQAEKDAMRSEALQVNSLRQQLDDELAAANFLAEKRINTPLTLDVLADVSSRVPEDTWIQRLQITGTELQLQGLSDGAQKLVGVLNDSGALSDTLFKGAISTDQRLNKERFTAAATIDPTVGYVPLELDEEVDGESIDGAVDVEQEVDGDEAELSSIESSDSPVNQKQAVNEKQGEQ